MLKAKNLSPLGAVAHAFFTREGGVSAGAFASFNCGFGSGDEPGHVGENRARALRQLGPGAAALVTCYQVHSKRAVIVSEPWEGGDAPEADAMVTDRPGIALGILTADCAPVLLADAEAGVVGAAHAGWRGALDGVIEATVVQMQTLGAAPARIVAAIGPCIGQASYEVGPEFFVRLLADDSANRGRFIPSVRDGHHMFDLEGYVAARLRRTGVNKVETMGLDTCADEKRFFSYRRGILGETNEYGRLLSAIMIGG